MTVAVQLGHQTVITLLMDNDSTYHRARLPALHVAAKRDDVRAASLLLQSTNKVLLSLSLSLSLSPSTSLLASQV